MGYEIEVVHPAAAQWLTDNGYTYEHEVRIEAGVIDFLATHRDGHKLILECKGSASGHLATLRQILDYKRELGRGYKCAIAVPSYSVTSAFTSACEKRKVKYVLLDVETRKSYGRGYLSPKAYGFFFWGQMQLMLDYHKQHDTNPALDFATLAEMASTFPIGRDAITEMISSEFFTTTLDWIVRPIGDVYFTPERIVSFVVDMLRGLSD